MLWLSNFHIHILRLQAVAFKVGNRIIIAPAVGAGVGMSFAVNDTVSIVVDYDYLYSFASSAQDRVDDFGIHSGNLGLRFSF